MPLYINDQNQHRLVVVHIPKTAGITIKNSLSRNQYRLTRPVPKYS